MSVENKNEERNQRATALLVKSLSPLALVGTKLSVSTQASLPHGYERWVQAPGSAFSMLLKLGMISCGALVLLVLHTHLLSRYAPIQARVCLCCRAGIVLCSAFGGACSVSELAGSPAQPFPTSLSNWLAGQGQVRSMSHRCHQYNL